MNSPIHYTTLTSNVIVNCYLLMTTPQPGVG